MTYLSNILEKEKKSESVHYKHLILPLDFLILHGSKITLLCKRVRMKKNCEPNGFTIVLEARPDIPGRISRCIMSPVFAHSTPESCKYLINE